MEKTVRLLTAAGVLMLLALWYLAGKVEAGRQYTEAELNELLDAWTLFHDPATLRRELYNKRLLDRTADGSRYWRADPLPELAELLARYVDAYCQYGTLNDYDLENLERLYLYQIAVCDYYGQYYASTASNRHIYLRQAQHATRLLQAAF